MKSLSVPESQLLSAAAGASALLPPPWMLAPSLEWLTLSLLLHRRCRKESMKPMGTLGNDWTRPSQSGTCPSRAMMLLGNELVDNRFCLISTLAGTDWQVAWLGSGNELDDGRVRILSDNSDGPNTRGLGGRDGS